MKFQVKKKKKKQNLEGRQDRVLKIIKLYIVLSVSPGWKGIVVKTEFQVNQALRRSVLEV
jgi:hypothetical protein